MTPSADEDFLFLDRGLDYLRRVEDIRSGLKNIVRSVAAAVGSDCASLYLLNHSAHALQPFVLVNIPNEYLKGCASVPLGAQCCGRAALHKVPWSVADMWTDPLFTDCAGAAREAGMRSGFSVPILMPDGECIGTLAAQFRHVHEASHADIARMGVFARLISMAVLDDTSRRGIHYREWVSLQLGAAPLAA